MRIADKMQYNQIIKNVSKNRSDMAQLQNQAATQKRVTKPSDDPTAAARVLGARTDERGNKQFIRGIESARSFLDFTDQALAELGEFLVRAKELAISQSNDASSNEQTRRTVAAEVSQIYDQSIQIANRKLGEQFIFGGFQTQTPPFNQEGEYLGDDGHIKVPVNKESFVTMNVPGNIVFLGEGTAEGGYFYSSTYTPQTTEQIREYKEQELERKREIESDRENIVETRGPASVGASKRQSDKDPVNQATGVNVFSAVKELEIALKSNDKIAVQESLTSIDKAFSQVVFARSELGARIMSINSLNDSLQKSIIDNKTTASQLEDADAFQTISEINKSDSALKATLETSGKLIQTSLLDFLR